jgi:hypothetical protein
MTLSFFEDEEADPPPLEDPFFDPAFLTVDFLVLL